MRSVLLLVLALLPACASPRDLADPPAGSGSIGEGGRISGQLGDADPYALRVVEGDAVLECGGAVVTLEGAAQGEPLSFDWAEDGARWTLRLPHGEARFGGGEMVVAGETHALQRGVAYRFDAEGRLVGEEAR